MIITNIKNFLEKNKKVFYYIFLFFIVSFLSSDMTFAEDNKTLFSVEGFIEAANVGIQLIGVMLAIGTYLATLFLSPEWINGSLFGLSKNFKEIWILVSNLVYFVFAFILIWIAFMNIIGKNADQYQLKQALPKFIVGVLIVPFSWFLVQFILSISAILTISALNLPFDTFSTYGASMKTISTPKDCTLNLSALKTSDSKTTDSKTTDNSNGQLIVCTYDSESVDKVTSIDSIFGIISLYTYGILKFDSVDDISANFIKETKTKAIGDVFVKVLFDTIFILVYGILIIAIALVLLIRGIYIWIYIMLSPVFGLMYFFDKKDGGGDGFFSKFNLKEFIALAMVPVYTMLALSFGLLFIYTVGVGLSSTDGAKDIKMDKDKLTLGNYSLTIKGNVGSIDSSNLKGFIDAIGKEAGSNGALGVIGTLILKVFGIVVLWGTVMAALRSSDVTKAIVEPLHQFGTKVGGIVSSAPGNMPIFGGQSMKSMSSTASTISSHIDGKSSKKGSDFAGKFINQDQDILKIQDAVRGINSGSDKVAKTKAAETVISSTNTTNKAQVDAMIKALSQIGFKDLKFEEIHNQSTQLIAKHLEASGKSADLGVSLDSYGEYVDRIDLAKGIISNKGVGDNRIIERTNKEYDELNIKPVIDNVKVQVEEGKQGIGSVFINGVNGVNEFKLKVDGGKDKSFENLKPNDRKELVDFYENLSPTEASQVDNIFKELGIGDGTKDFKSAIEDYIEKNKK